MSSFVSIDLETTGLDPKKCRILEFGAVRYEDGKETERFSELVAITESVPPEITQITGITDADLIGKKSLKQLFRPFVDFVGSSPVVGQNVRFDIGFIEGELDRLSLNERPPWRPGMIYDTKHLASIFYPTLSGFGLSNLCRELEINLENHHRAVHDASATAEVFLGLLERVRRIPAGELRELTRILGGGSVTLHHLFEALKAIGNGDSGKDEGVEFQNNLLGDWGESSEESADRRLGAQDIEGYLDDHGPLARIMESFQQRDGQINMATDVLKVLNEGGKLFAEAGTGTGKSFAYSLPSLLHARNGGGKVIISTHTRHLQNQLFFKDMPLLNTILGGGIKVVLMKGRGNYICKRRYNNLISAPESLDAGERFALLPLVRWIDKTESGDITEVNGFRPLQNRLLWQKVSSDAGYCSTKVCRASKNCFLHKVRSSSQSAHIVLVNHALLLSDLQSENSILGEYKRVIFDEAHHLEKMAASHLGFVYQRNLLSTALGILYDSETDRGILRQIKDFFIVHKTDLERARDDDKSVFEDLFEEIQSLKMYASDFHDRMESTLRKKTPSPDHEYSQKIRYRSGEELFASMKETLAAFTDSYVSLLIKLEKLVKELGEMEVTGEQGDDLVAGLNRSFSELQGIAEALFKLIGEEDKNTVFWYELPTNHRYPVTLNGAPIDVGIVLNEKLHKKMTTMVFCSATMAVDDNFEYIASRLGVESYTGKIYPSPFKLENQLFIGVTNLFGLPKGDNLNYFTSGVAKLTRRLSTELDAGTLVLFTSSRMLRDAYEKTAGDLKRLNWLPLGQGIDGSQFTLLKSFQKERRSVLFGVDSFWKVLMCLVIPWNC
ncbi:3'-5' exoribonuclease [bacterium]|nr:3'-5' exoribonuclease [bacterium]